MTVDFLSNRLTYLVSSFTGITRFDLLGDFGRFNWLGNFYIVLSYNLLFAVVTTLCLVRKFTSAIREELLKALGKFVFYSFDHILSFRQCPAPLP